MPRLAPQDLDHLVAAVVEKLAAAGLLEASMHLAGVRESGWTTRWEWLGELGQAVRRAREASPIPPAINQDLDAIMAEVRSVWPSIP